MLHTPRLHLLILFSAALFVIALIISAIADSSIRVLHMFEALPYIAAPLLCRAKPKMGYMAAFACGAFWIWTAGFLTTFIRNGFERIMMLLQTGHVDRPDILLAVPAFLGTLGMVAFSFIGYVQVKNKSWKDAGLLCLSVLFICLYFIAIASAFKPEYLHLFDGIFWKGK